MMNCMRILENFVLGRCTIPQMEDWLSCQFERRFWGVLATDAVEMAASVIISTVVNRALTLFGRYMYTEIESTNQIKNERIQRVRSRNHSYFHLRNWTHSPACLLVAAHKRHSFLELVRNEKEILPSSCFCCTFKPVKRICSQHSLLYCAFPKKEFHYAIYLFLYYMDFDGFDNV